MQLPHIRVTHVILSSIYHCLLATLACTFDSTQGGKSHFIDFAGSTFKKNIPIPGGYLSQVSGNTLSQEFSYHVCLIQSRKQKLKLF